LRSVSALVSAVAPRLSHSAMLNSSFSYTVFAKGRLIKPIQFIHGNYRPYPFASVPSFGLGKDR
jgi:hypothetical protein